MLDPLEAFLTSLAQKSQSIPSGDNEAPTVKSAVADFFSTHDATVPGSRIIRMFPMITARSVIGVPIGTETILSMFQSCDREVKKLEAAMCQLEAEVLQKLRSLAAERNCQAVIGLSVQFGEAASTSLVQYMFAAAQGTPVQLESDLANTD